MGDFFRKAGSAGEAGEIIKVGGKRYICAYTALTDIVEGQPLKLNAVPSGTTLLVPTVTAPITQTTPAQVVVSESAISAAGWYWFVFSGKCKALVLGAATVLPGSWLKVTSTGVNFVTSSTVGATNITTHDAAVYVDSTYTTTSAALKWVYLDNRQSQVG